MATEELEKILKQLLVPDNQAIQQVKTFVLLSQRSWLLTLFFLFKFNNLYVCKLASYIYTILTTLRHQTAKKT